MWSAYTNDWHMMDFWYRTFCSEFDSCGKSSFDVAGNVTDELENLAAWVEGVYVNWFLSETKPLLGECRRRAMGRVWLCRGRAQQRRFFDEFVVAVPVM